MIALTLVAKDGQQIAPALSRSRFVARGGDLLDFAQIGARPTLAEAREAFDDLRARIAAETDINIRCLLARDALGLAEAIVEVCAQRRAAGWRVPEDADKVRA